jgi:hypothetical protein
MQQLLEASIGKTIRLNVGEENNLQGKLINVFPEYIEVDVPSGFGPSGTRYVFTDHIRWISFPEK